MTRFVKKWVSACLAGIMTAMLFGGFSVSANEDEMVSMADGGTLWYYWDFTDGLTAPVGKLNFYNTSGTKDTITQSDGRAKLTFTGASATLVYSTSPDFRAATDNSARTDRYLVMETDLASSDDVTSATFEARKTNGNDNVVFYKNSDGKYKDTHYVVVFDMQEKKTTIFEQQAIGNSNIITSEDYGKALPKYTGDFEKIAETTGLTKYAGANQFRFSYTGKAGSVIEFDNFGISTYKELYRIINSATDDETCLNALASFDNMQIIALPYEYRKLPAGEKLEIAKSLREHDDDFTTNDEVLAHINSLLPSQTTVATVYYDWDFEDKGLVDSARDKVFLKDHPNYVKGGVTYAVDPENATNHVAKVDFSVGQSEKLVFSDPLVKDADKFQIAVYDMKIYLESGEDTDVTFSLGSGTNRKNLLYQYSHIRNSWVPVKAVIDKTAGTAMIYIHNGQKWELNGHLDDLNDFSFFARFSFSASNRPTLYVDDFKVSVYEDFYKKVSQATAENLAAVLEEFAEQQIVALPDPYYSLEGESKAAFIQAMKDGTYTSDEQVKKAIDANLEKSILWVNGEVDTKYAAGSLRMRVPVNVDKDTVDVMLIAAQYDVETGVLIQCAVEEKTIVGYDSVEITMNVEQQGGTEIRVFLWRTGDIMPLRIPIHYEPHPEQNNEG